MSDDTQQNALANVYELAAALHSHRAAAVAVEALLADAMKQAHRAGISQVLIADATALTRGRVSQIVNGAEPDMSAKEIARRVSEITSWPGDELRTHRSSFGGVMTYPPYVLRRSNVKRMSEA